MLGTALKSRKVPKKTTKVKKVVKKEPHKFSENEVKDLKTAFNLLDKNTDGHVSASELEEMLMSMGMPLKQDLIDMLIKKASKEGKDVLDENEFMQWIHKIQTIREEEPQTGEGQEEEDLKKDLLAAFSVFDKDGNGIITKDELQSAMEIIDETITEDQLTEIFKMADVDRDGKINYEDFLKVLL